MKNLERERAKRCGGFFQTENFLSLFVLVFFFWQVFTLLKGNVTKQVMKCESVMLVVNASFRMEYIVQTSLAVPRTNKPIIKKLLNEFCCLGHLLCFFAIAGV